MAEEKKATENTGWSDHPAVWVEGFILWLSLIALFAGGAIAVATQNAFAGFAETILRIDPADPWSKVTAFMIITPAPFMLAIKYLRRPLRRALRLES